MIQNTLKFKKGDYIYKTGDESDFLYILKEGLVHVFRSDGKHEIDFGVIGVGGVVGESVLADMPHRQTSVLVIESVVALVLSKEEFKVAIEGYEPWVFGLTRTLISRHERVIERVERNLDDYIDASVAQLLCFYAKSDADLFVPKIVAQMAMLLRTSEENVLTSLELLSKFGFIKIANKTIYIPNSEHFIIATNELRLMTLEEESYVKDFQSGEGSELLHPEKTSEGA
ncbi:MAG: Crp/Fnr family transcriptional regulator [Fibrobacterales bacterium]